MLADHYGWDKDIAYQANPLVSDSEDERHIKCTLKEANVLQEEKIKDCEAQQKNSFRPYQSVRFPYNKAGYHVQITCLKCHRRC